MNASYIARIVAGITSAGLTFILFSSVAGLAEPPKSSTAMQLAAKAPVVVAQAGQSSQR